MEKSTVLHFLTRMANSVNRMETATQEFKNDLLTLFGYFSESELNIVIANDQFSSQQSNNLIPQSNGFGNQEEMKSTDDIIEEVKSMIVELKIKGSVRERPNGLIEFRSQALGSIYGRTKDEIEQKLTKALKETRKCKNKLNNAEKNKTPLLSEFFVTHYLPYKKNQGRSVASMESYESLFRYIEKSAYLSLFFCLTDLSSLESGSICDVSISAAIFFRECFPLDIITSFSLFISIKTTNAMQNSAIQTGIPHPLKGIMEPLPKKL